MKEYIVQATAPDTIKTFDEHNAPQIVRCKDCKYCTERGGGEVKVAVCLLKHNWMPQPYWFCADGERKDT